MPEVYKVGLTTGSVKQRIQELNTTGVPRPFKAEKIFEIPQSTLRDVEQLAHRKLKNKDLHVEWQRKVSHYLQPILSHRFLNNLA